MQGDVFLCHFVGKLCDTFGAALTVQSPPICGIVKCPAERTRHSGKLCEKHNREWLRLLASPKPRGIRARRLYQCQEESCTEWHLPGERTRGRKLGSTWLCRNHEHLHLQDALTWEMLESGMRPVDECWIYEPGNGFEATNDGDYGKFYPPGTGVGTSWKGKSYDTYWPAHRATWLMFVGPLRMGWELDHLDDCPRPACCNPSHLEPVTSSVNKQRLHSRNRVAKGLEVRTVRACGPRFNKDMAVHPPVRNFANPRGLPLPQVD